MTSVSSGSDANGTRERACVFTTLVGGYERLTEQPVAVDSSLDFLCFTDDPTLESETWTIRHVDLLLPHDPVRSQRGLKLRAHAAVPEYDVSLYIDNTVMLTAPPERMLDDLFPSDAGLALMRHAFRETVDDEFDVVVAAGLDHRERCAEQRAHYRRDDPESLDLRPLAATILMRRHNVPRVVAAMDLWFTHILRYARRDQLSAWYALRAAGLEPVVLDIDNFESPYHRWPVETARRKDTSLWERDEFVQMRQRLIDLEAELATVNASRAWRWTAPVRRLRARQRAIGDVQLVRSESTSPEPSQAAASR